VATVTITVDPVDDPPVAVDDVASTDGDVSVVVDVLANDVDVDSDVLTVTNLGTPDHGTSVVGADGTVTYTPDVGFSGRDTFTYTANDGTLDSAPATVSVSVACVNDGPIAGTIDDTFAVATVPFSLDVSGSFTEPKGEDMTFSAVGLPTSLSIDPVTGIISGTPTVGEIASYSVTVTAADPTDGEGSTSFTLEVVPVEIFTDGFED
jgi:VCBS repeat-containing protein